jgi:glyoxylase-like metal-dependent hydrolase (beta-lactamase superfamily II)
MFWCEEERILISGDALWEQGFGIVLPDPPEALNEARATLERIAALRARIVIPGHGPPFTAVQKALDRCFSRLDALQADPLRSVRTVLKVMLSFSLLERGRLPLAGAAAWLQGVPMYREYNERYLRLPPEQLAQWLIGELEKAGAAHREGEWLVANAP